MRGGFLGIAILTGGFSAKSSQATCASSSGEICSREAAATNRGESLTLAFTIVDKVGECRNLSYNSKIKIVRRFFV